MKKDGFLMSNRELSYVGAALAGGLFFALVAGYFWGRQRTLDELALQYDDECFADKISQSLSMLSDQVESDEAGSPGTEDEPEADVASETETIAGGSENVVEVGRPEMAFAQLCGFGTRQAAEEYAKRLERRAIPSNVVEHKSYSKKGRTSAWYQVVTQPMEKQDLAHVVARLKEADKLGDVRIVEVSNVEQ